MDRFAALAAFRATAEAGSFAAAARRLGLSPAAVSKTVAELETRLNVRLFNRTTRRMSLTEAGAVYLGHVGRILDELAEADRALDPLHQAARGTLRVAAPLTGTLVGLSRAIPHFLRAYPDIRLDLDLDDRRVDIVRDGYDLAIRGGEGLEDSSLTARRLAVMTHVLCAAPAYLAAHGVPQQPEDLRTHECVRFSLSGHADIWEFRQEARTVRVPVSGRYSVTSSLAVRDALREGFGISLIPRGYVREDLAAGRLVPLLEDWQTVEIAVYAIYPSRRLLAPKLRVFLDFLVAELGSPRAGF
ncbi:LysR substrate-binding domain-containing protein [Segnochrobactraceae bacterium EtOH-i3]